MTKQFAVGTSLCILAALSVMLFSFVAVPKAFYSIPVILVLVGFAIQSWTLWGVRPGALIPKRLFFPLTEGDRGYLSPKDVVLSFNGKSMFVKKNAYFTQIPYGPHQVFFWYTDGEILLRRSAIIADREGYAAIVASELQWVRYNNLAVRLVF